MPGTHDEWFYSHVSVPRFVDCPLNAIIAKTVAAWILKYDSRRPQAPPRRIAPAGLVFSDSFLAYHATLKRIL